MDLILYSIYFILQEGYANVDKILAAVYSYLAMLQREGPSSRIFQEIQQIEQLDFDYRLNLKFSTNKKILIYRQIVDI